MYTRFALFVLLFFSSHFLNSQTKTLELSLSEVVTLAQSDAPDVLIANNQLNTNYWQNQFFLAGYKPQISLNAEPDLFRSIDEITLPTGASTFVRRAQMNNGIDLRLSQQITKTGGTVFASTGMERIDIFKTTNNDASTLYLTNPISLGFIQPIFSYNRLKWDKEIQPLNYAESTKEYAEDMEAVARTAAQLFFEVLIAQLNLAAAKQDKINADTLYNISKGRFGVGKIAETELLNIELRALNADAAVAQASLNVQTNSEQLRNYLGIKEAVIFDLETPTVIPTFLVNADKALEFAKMNRSDNTSFARRLKVAESEVDRAKKAGFEIELFASFGLTQTGITLGDAFNDLLDRERVNLGISMPIADWGLTKSRREIAASNLDLEKARIAQEKVEFEQQILIRVQQFDLVRNQVKLAKRAYEASIKREDITRKRIMNCGL